MRVRDKEVYKDGKRERKDTKRDREGEGGETPAKPPEHPFVSAVIC